MKHPIKQPKEGIITTLFPETAFPGNFVLDLAELNSPEQQGLRDYYQNAWDLALKLPFPAQKSQAWRRTDLSGLDFAQLSQHAGAASLVAVPELQATEDEKYAAKLRVSPHGSELSEAADIDTSGLIFTDFRNAEKSHPELLARLAGSLIPASEGKFAAIASALAHDGAFLYVPSVRSVEAPFLVSIEADAATAFFSHVIIYLEAGAQARLSLRYGSSASGDGTQNFHSGLVEIWLGEGAVLDLSETQDFASNLWNISYEKAAVAGSASLNWTYGSLGSRFTKGFVTVDLLAPGAQAEIDGFNFSSGRQQIDLDTRQNHLAEHTTSNLLFKGAVNGKSKTVWQGMIYVAPEAMGTDAYQSNRSLVLSDSAEVDAIPGLEILADDVRCSHGATVGKLDEEEIFYFESRGISKGDAEKLLVEAFLAEVVEKDISSAHQDVLKNKIRTKLEETG